MLKQFNLYQIRGKLLKINFFSQTERKIIYNRLKKYSKGGGISYSELLKVIRGLRKEYKISEVDEKYLRKILNELK